MAAILATARTALEVVAPDQITTFRCGARNVRLRLDLPFAPRICRSGPALIAAIQSLGRIREERSSIHPALKRGSFRYKILRSLTRLGRLRR